MSGVIINGHTIECEYIVLATGMWSRQIGEDSDLVFLYILQNTLQLQKILINYQKNSVLRDFDDCLYLKEDAGKMLIEFLKVNQFRLTKLIDPEDFSYGEFPENFEHFEPYLESCLKRVPLLEKAGIRKFFVGPEFLRQIQILY